MARRIDARLKELGITLPQAATPVANYVPYVITGVINGASDIMVEIFGDAGRHARSAVSAPSLPVDIAVEVEAIFEIE